MTKVYTAKDIRQRFTSRAYYGGYVVAYEAQMLYHPDIVTVKKNLKLCEYEIKVSWKDLRKELDIIDAVLAEDTKVYSEQMPLSLGSMNEYSKWINRMPRGNKYTKHRHYLRGHAESRNLEVPSLFYFILPRELYNRAEQRFAGLPYGVIDADTFYCLRRPKSLHKETVPAITLWYIAQNITGRLPKETEES